MGYTYSFLDVQAAISGPGGNFPLAGDESGNSEEGITIEPTGDKNIMTVGADGSVMHSLKGDRSGTVTVRLLKTSTINAALQALYDVEFPPRPKHDHYPRRGPGRHNHMPEGRLCEKRLENLRWLRRHHGMDLSRGDDLRPSRSVSDAVHH